jgi:enolase
MFVKDVIPSFVKNSRGEVSIQIEVVTFEGRFKTSAPSGKSKGKSEVVSYNSKGIGHSMKMLRSFCPKLRGENFIIKKVDNLKPVVALMRKFEAKYGKFGGNVNYAFEGAFLKAAAADNGKELWEFINDDVNDGLKPKIPMPVGNCIGGGLHSKTIKGKKPDFQEFLLIPKEETFSRAVTTNLRAYGLARKLLEKRQKEWRVKRSDEGAWMTSLTNEDVLDILKEVSKHYKLRIGLDVAASSFYKNGYYRYKNKELIRDKVDQSDYMERLIKKFGIFYVEDGMHEEDFGGFKEILSSVKKTRSLIVGDDLTTTNLKRVHRAVRSKSINAMIIKPNQIGSILEVKRVVEFCKKNDIKMIFSHRSGETVDDTLADYCIGFGGQFIKCGIFGKERLIKLKRVIDIEKKLS